jgi:hypothetical protein
VGVYPALVAGFATGTLLVKTPDRLGVIGINLGFGNKPFNILPILLLGVVREKIAKRAIGFDDAGVDAEVAAFKQTVFVETGENLFEGSLEDSLAKTMSDHAQSGMVESSFIEAVSKDGAQRE